MSEAVTVKVRVNGFFTNGWWRRAFCSPTFCERTWASRGLMWVANTGSAAGCTLMLDGATVRSCLMFAVQVDGSEVTTIEGPRPGRQTPSASGGLLETPRLAVWILHSGDALHRSGIARGESQAHRSGDSGGNFRHPVPLYGLPPGHSSGQGCGAEHGPGREVAVSGRRSG